MSRISTTPSSSTSRSRRSSTRSRPVSSRSYLLVEPASRRVAIGSQKDVLLIPARKPGGEIANVHRSAASHERAACDRLFLIGRRLPENRDPGARQESHLRERGCTFKDVLLGYFIARGAVLR